MCNCMDDTLLKITDEVRANMPDNADKATLRAGWVGKVFRFDSKKNNVLMKVDFKYQKIKADGTPYKNWTRDSVGMEMSYCPFCGAKYD